MGRRTTRAYPLFLTDPDAPLSAAADKRLHTLSRASEQGAGFHISADDMDQRGGGDLLSGRQSGHIQLLGPELSGQLLARATGDGGRSLLFDGRSQLHLDIITLLPNSYIRDAAVRLQLYARIFKSGSEAELDDIEEEMEERFGKMPPQAHALLAFARLERQCAGSGIVAVDPGPHLLAATLDPAAIRPPATFRDERLEWKEAGCSTGVPAIPPKIDRASQTGASRPALAPQAYSKTTGVSGGAGIDGGAHH